jgi:DNA repair protein RadC
MGQAMRTKNTTSGTANIPGFVSEAGGKYQARKALTEAQIIKAAKALLDRRYRPGRALTNPDSTRDWLRINYQDLEHEVFICLFLDSQHRIIAHEILFRGTIKGAAIHPREVAKRALQLNAAAVIFAHNHPSGASMPSPADRDITQKLKQSLALFEVAALDHFVIGKDDVFSFAENGMM